MLLTALPDAPAAPLPAHAERLTLPPDPVDAAAVDAAALLDELARRGVWAVFLEGGGRTAGRWHDRGLIDEVRAFVAPTLLGGGTSPTPLAGAGFPAVTDDRRLHRVRVEPVGGDVLVTGLVTDPEAWFAAASGTIRA